MTHQPPANPDPIDKALRMLALLDDAGKAEVLNRMSPEQRQRIEQRLETTPDNARPHAAFSTDIAGQRRLLRQTAEEMYEEKMRRVREAIAADGLDPDLAVTAMQAGTASTAQLLDPLAELRFVHPAAIARAMQGERAEAWAIVLDRLDENARAALESYLDRDALAAIQQARLRQAELRATSSAIATTIEKAIGRTVVPIALREHQLLVTNYPPGVPHGTAF